MGIGPTDKKSINSLGPRLPQPRLKPSAPPPAEPRHNEKANPIKERPHEKVVAHGVARFGAAAYFVCGAVGACCQ